MAGDGNDRIIGIALDNTLEGDAGDNFTLADDRDDILVDGLGVDILIDGFGADTLVFNSLAELALGRTRGILLDLSPAQGDKIDLRMMDANDLLARCGLTRAASSSAATAMWPPSHRLCCPA
ncbi:MAG: Ca2+-binding RTX toxin-like protein [Rhodoferax sp.]|jgi:Ca2+-binding RTX toxin-like protein